MGRNLQRITSATRKLWLALWFPFVFFALLFLGFFGFEVKKKREEEEDRNKEAQQGQVEEADEDDPRKRSYAKDQWLADYTGEQRMEIAQQLQSWDGAKVTPVVPFEEWQAEREARRQEALAAH